jgi:hypothetical protein
MASQRAIRDQPFQFRVLFAELPEVPSFTEAQPRIFPFPQGERLLADADFATDCRDRRPALRLPSGGQDLLFAMPSSSCHRRVLLLSQEDHAVGHFLTLPLAYCSGFGSLVTGDNPSLECLAILW